MYSRGRSNESGILYQRRCIHRRDHRSAIELKLYHIHSDSACRVDGQRTTSIFLPVVEASVWYQYDMAYHSNQLLYSVVQRWCCWCRLKIYHRQQHCYVHGRSTIAFQVTCEVPPTLAVVVDIIIMMIGRNFLLGNGVSIWRLR